MSDIQHGERLECLQLVHRFYLYLDTKRYDDLVSLFLPDGVWNRLGVDLTGPDEIRAVMSEREDWITAHVVTNVLVDVVSPDEAQTSQYVTLYRSEGNGPDGGPGQIEPPLGVLWHRDTLTLTEEGWRFRRKTSRAILVNHDRVPHYRSSNEEG